MNRLHAAVWFTLSLFAVAVRAAPITYTIENLTFADGGTVSGTFTFDASTDIYTAWDIATTATVDPSVDGGYPLSAATYASSDPSSYSYLNPNGYVFHNGISTNNSLSLTFASPLTDAGGTIPIKAASESQNYGFETRGGYASLGSISSNAVVVAAVPEPRAYISMLGGLGICVLLAYRQNKKSRTDKWLSFHGAIA